MILLKTIDPDNKYGAGRITVEADPRDGELYLTQEDESAPDGGVCIALSPRMIDGLQQALGLYIRKIQK